MVGLEGGKKKDGSEDDDKRREVADMIEALRKRSSGERTGRGDEEASRPHEEESEKK